MGVILADIGGGTTDIAVFRDGSIWHTAILPVAGYQLTRDVAIGLGLPFDVAEEMKKKYGSVMPVYDSKAETTSPMSENGHGVSYQDLCDILRARIEEILRLILLEMPRTEYEELVPAGLVLTGGSSNLTGMEILGRDILRLPVRVGVPTEMNGIAMPCETRPMLQALAFLSGEQSIKADRPGEHVALAALYAIWFPESGICSVSGFFKNHLVGSK
jgi:cell division protein FtsA